MTDNDTSGETTVEAAAGDIETSENSLTIRRRFEAPVERVYRAFTDPDELAEWYAPGEMTTEVDRFDPSPGGTISITMVGEEERWSAEGTFQEVVENERLVHSWQDPQEEHSLVTVEFEPVETGTEVVFTHKKLDGPESVNAHLDGWVGILENLADAL